MGQVAINLNGRSYSLACEHGEEERLLLLAAHVREKLESVVGDFGQVGEARLMLITSLLIADELFDARAACDMSASAAASAALREAAERARETPSPGRPDPKAVNPMDTPKAASNG